MAPEPRGWIRGQAMENRYALMPSCSHQRDVVGPPVVVVVGDVAGLAVPDRARPPAEGVPDRLAAAVVGYRALNLVRSRGDAPGEAGRERREGKIAHELIVAGLLGTQGARWRDAGGH